MDEAIVTNGCDSTGLKFTLCLLDTFSPNDNTFSPHNHVEAAEKCHIFLKEIVA